eukprot:g1577.t1
MIGASPQWRKALKAYEYETRVTNNWKPPDRRVTAKEVYARERSFNPILQHFIDPFDRKRQRKEEEKAQRNRKMKATTSNKSLVRYDIVNHTMKESNGKQKQKIKIKRKPDSRTPYNIVTHAMHSGPEWKTEKRENGNLKSKKLSYNHNVDYNIISNIYLTRPQQKVHKEKMKNRKILFDRLEKRAYDPVACKFFNDKEEFIYMQKRRMEEKIHGRAQVNRLPPDSRNAEGNLYNIINHQVRNGAAWIESKTLLHKKDEAEKEMLSLKMKERIALEAVQKKKNELAALYEQRNLNRFRKKHAKIIHPFEKANQAYERIILKRPSTAVARLQKTGEVRIGTPKRSARTKKGSFTNRGRGSRSFGQSTFVSVPKLNLHLTEKFQK